MKPTIGIIGAGSWGTALAFTVSKNAKQVYLLARNAEQASILKQDNQNKKYLPGYSFPDHLSVESSYECLTQCDIIISVVPTAHYRSIFQKISSEVSLTSKQIILNASKGIELATGLGMSSILKEYFPEAKVGVLSGPTYAEEVMDDLPTCCVIAMDCDNDVSQAQLYLSHQRLRCYRSLDLRGVELAGTVKNTMAIASGISRGLGFGYNATSALITRGLAEMIRLGAALGCNPETFMGLSGVGDLISTCSTDMSRNFQVGLKLSEGKSVEQAIAEIGMVTEGVPNTESIYELARKHGVRTPLIDAVYSILFQDFSAIKALQSLLETEPGTE